VNNPITTEERVAAMDTERLINEVLRCYEKIATYRVDIAQLRKDNQAMVERCRAELELIRPIVQRWLRYEKEREQV
jgi:hypothetical protein